MNYIGSKHSLMSFLEESIAKIAGDNTDRVFCDLFAGTGAVGLFFKKKGYQVIANDIQYYSYVMNRHLIGNHNELLFSGLVEEIKELIDSPNDNKKNIVCNYLNCICLKEGFIYKNYCANGRQYYTPENGKKCDAIRLKIEEWKNEKKINNDEYYFLIATLLERMDKVANTASVYGAFLKNIKKSAQNVFEYAPLPLYLNTKEHIIYNENVNSLIKKIDVDILYLDPPYNTRQYASNYHVLETIAKYDNPNIKGKTGLRDYEKQKSKYCSKGMVKNEFKDLIENAKAKYIFLSYNNEGLLSLEDIKEIMSCRGKYGYFKKEYNRFKADNNRNYKDSKTTEYLHYVIVEN